MNRSIALLLTLVLMLSLMGCSVLAEEEDRGFDSTRSFAHYLPQVIAAETSDTVYFLGDGDSYLKYVDKDTGISGPLCGKAECRHNDETCNAYLGLIVKDIFVNDGRIYWVAQPPLSILQYFLYSAALDGTDRREETELPREMVQNLAGYYHFVLHGGMLYLGDIQKEVVDGQPKFYSYIAAFPLESDKEPFVIMQEEIKYDNADNNVCIQFYKDNLYILTNTLNDLSAENETELYDLKLRQWNVETGELKILYEEKSSPLSMTMELWVMDNGVIFNRNYCTADELETRIYRYDFNTGECKYLFENGIYGWVNMGIIADDLVTGYQMTDNREGVYDFHVVLKNFEGKLLIDETYTFDLRDEFTNYSRYETDFLGRDEKCAYYTFYGSETDAADNTLVCKNYMSMIAVALDGSGAWVMCTQYS